VGTISSTGARTFKKPVCAIVLRALFRLQRVGFFATLIIATIQEQQPKLDVIVIRAVTLRQVPEGKIASARAVANPADYANIPELQMMKMGPPRRRARMQFQALSSNPRMVVNREILVAGPIDIFRPSSSVRLGFSTERTGGLGLGL
jgi:hypothetical protein